MNPTFPLRANAKSNLSRLSSIVVSQAGMWQPRGHLQTPLRAPMPLRQKAILHYGIYSAEFNRARPEKSPHWFSFSHRKHRRHKHRHKPNGKAPCSADCGSKAPVCERVCGLAPFPRPPVWEPRGARAVCVCVGEKASAGSRGCRWRLRGAWAVRWAGRVGR